MFALAPEESAHKDKVVQLFPLDAEQEKTVREQAAGNRELEAGDGQGLEGYDEIGGVFYREYKPVDISITKNVLALLIAAVLVTLMVMGLARYYGRKGYKAPRKGMAFFELLVSPGGCR